MKKHWLPLAVVVGFVTAPVVAHGLTFTAFHSDITVNTDASITVVETLTADFTEAQHGIFRTIPYRFSTQNGERASIPITQTSISQDGLAAKYTTSNDGNNIKIKIGDPNKTIIGSHEYTIQYTAEAATNFFTDHDELYWNVSGTEWDAPISNISTTVHLPRSFSADQITTTCYTGSYGSTTQNCQQLHTADTASASANEYLTIVVGWPVGAVIKPANFDQLRASGTTTVSPWTKSFHGWMLGLNILLPLLAVVAMFQLWWTRGRDPGQHRSIIAQYDPPDALRPAELYCLLHEQVNTKALPSTIVDLAVRGYIKIIQTEKSTMLGMSHATEYILRSLKAPDEKLRAFEKELLETLFAEKLFPASDTDLRLSDLKKRKYTSNPFAPIFSDILTQMVGAEYFQGNPNSVRSIWAVGGILVAGLGGLLIYFGFPLFGLIVAGIIVASFSGSMPRRTAKGVEAVWIGQGFKLFLEKAEKYRIHWQERENIFETFLPYAMVFGIADKWSKAFSDVATTNPSWYEGQPGASFNTMVFWGAMSNFGSSMNTSVVSAAASGSSGFSGGFSGGGGGGGGGGGW